MRFAVLIAALVTTGCSTLPSDGEVDDTREVPQPARPVVKPAPAKTEQRPIRQPAPPPQAAATQAAATPTAATTDRDSRTATPQAADALSGAGPRLDRGITAGQQIEYLEIVLRSTPPGAMATIDDTRVGVTPTFWRGPKISSVRTFRFTLAGYRPAEYFFVPIRSGVIHATLTPLRENKDAGPP